MDCATAREAISAILDGEPPGVDRGELERHLDDCRDCRAWRDGAHIVTRRARVALAHPAPAVSDSLLATLTATSRKRRRPGALTGARLALVAVAVAQIAVTVPQLILGSDHDAPIHVAHEMGSFDMALAAGFLAVAWQPTRARGMHVLVGAAALLLVLTAAIDLAAGRTSPSDELPHLLAVAGWLLMYRIAAITPSRERSTATTPLDLLRRQRSEPIDIGDARTSPEDWRSPAIEGDQAALPPVERQAGTG